MNNYFLNKYIDDIKVDYNRNYFSPILEHCMNYYKPKNILKISIYSIIFLMPQV